MTGNIIRNRDGMRDVSAWEQKQNKSPLLLRPAGKDYLWGGNRLNSEYGKNIPMEPLAETWECSAHPDGPSRIASSRQKGRLLSEVLREHPDWLGTHPRCEEGLPVLIKFIDAAKDLSVQVHPDDEYALWKEGQLGKTEMWYVLDAEPGASLIYGFAHDMNERKVRRSIANGHLMRHLQSVPVHKDDVFFIRPGTIHAIGAGVLIAEIQESSNVTYRVYDYGRKDKDGRERELHVDKALEVMNYKAEQQVRQQMRVMRYGLGSATEILCRCQYFQVERVLVTSEHMCRVESNSFQVLLVLEGDLTVGTLNVGKGDCVFLPAGCGEVKVLGKGQMLKVRC